MISALLFATLSITPFQQDASTTLVDLVSTFQVNEGAVGVSAAVVSENHQWQATSGWTDRESRKAVEATTLFRLGSVSKQVAATAVMQLVDAGKLDIDENVNKYVPGFPEPDGKVTLRQLMCHTAGIRHYSEAKNESLYEFVPTAKALKMFVDDPRIGKPGEKYSYSTHAFTVVVAAVENASGMTYTDYVRKYIASGTSLDCELLSDNKPQRSALYTRTKGSPRLETKREDNSWKFGGGGIESTAPDLAKFGYNVLTTRLVTAQSRDAMWTPQKTNDGKEIDYGLGWGIGSDGLIQHSGGQQGCSCYLLIDPKRKVSVAVMCNTSNINVGQLARDLLKAWK